MAALEIPITKAGKGVTFVIDTEVMNELGNEQYLRVLTDGWKGVLNSRMSNIESPIKVLPENVEAHKAFVLAAAKKNFDDFIGGTLTKRTSNSKAAAASRAVMTEARRLAKETVKSEIRRAGSKPSLVEPRVITAAANELVKTDPWYVSQAETNIADREKVAAGAKADFASLELAESPRLQEKAEKAAAERKAALSAKQASKPAKSAKKVLPKKPSAVVHTLPAAH